MLTVTPSTELGFTLDQLQTILAKADKYVDIVTDAMKDPALDPFVQRIRTLRDSQPKMATKPGVAPAKPPGIGLSKFIAPLDAFIWYQKNKWVVPVGIAGTVVLLGGIFAVGRVSKRCRCPV